MQPAFIGGRYTTLLYHDLASVDDIEALTQRAQRSGLREHLAAREGVDVDRTCEHCSTADVAAYLDGEHTTDILERIVRSLATGHLNGTKYF